MSERTGSCFTLTLVMALILQHAPVQAQSTVRAGQVSEINRNGFQYASGGVDYLNQNDAIVRDARLETDLVGEMALTMDDGTQLVMPSSSEVVIDEFIYDPDRTSGEAAFSLLRGALRMVSGRMRSESYRMETPSATIGVRGTDFTVELRPGKGMVVTVDEGAVEIRLKRNQARFRVPAGQIWICSDTICRMAGSDDLRVRRASLGPPMSQPLGEPGQNPAPRLRLAALDTALDQAGATSACPAYRIPDSAYQRIGLDPANWPSDVEGITTSRPGLHGLTEKQYCPDQIDFAGSTTSFRVLGHAAPGDSQILYFVNTVSGQRFFQSGFNQHRQEKADGKAYGAFVLQGLRQQPGIRILQSSARMKRTGRNQLVLRQYANVRATDQAYAASGITLFRPVSGGRTAMFAIPSVVKAKSSTSPRSALEIARTLFGRLPDPVTLSRAPD